MKKKKSTAAHEMYLLNATPYNEIDMLFMAFRKKVQIILLFLCTTLTERQVLKWTHETVSICWWFSTENDYLSNDFGGKMANDPKQTVQPNESNHFAWVIFITAEIAAYLFLCSTIKNWISVETDYERKKCCVATQNEGNFCKKWEFE